LSDRRLGEINKNWEKSSKLLPSVKFSKDSSIKLKVAGVVPYFFPIILVSFRKSVDPKSSTGEM
jgi:hypothetical protein